MKIKILEVKVNQAPVLKTINVSYYELMQCYGPETDYIIDIYNPVAYIFKKNGSLYDIQNEEYNRPLNLIGGRFQKHIFGDFIVCGLNFDAYFNRRDTRAIAGLTSVPDDLVDPVIKALSTKEIIENPILLGISLKAEKMMDVMVSFGYVNKFSMAPIDLSQAEELFYLTPIYLLFSDDTEAVAETIDEMVAHVEDGGLLGFSRDDVQVDLIERFASTPFNIDTQCITEPFHDFPVGTPRRDILFWLNNLLGYVYQVDAASSYLL